MANIRDIRKRVRSVKNTQQITRAMKMVAAAKLRRAQEAALASRPYARKLGDVLGALAAQTDTSAHSLFDSGESNKTALVVVTADRGLCGGFNTNLCRAAAEEFHKIESAGREPTLFLIGRKGYDFFRRRDYPILKEKLNIFARLSYGDAKDLADDLVALFESDQVGQVRLVYNEFKSVMQPKINCETLLPIAAPQGNDAGATEYEYEPDADSLLQSLVPWHIRTQIWRVLQESAAAEHASRMTAMESATKNAGEMIDKLTLHMNKVRQAGITTELIEVVSGAAALE